MVYIYIIEKIIPIDSSFLSFIYKNTIESILFKRRYSRCSGVILNETLTHSQLLKILKIKFKLANVNKKIISFKVTATGIQKIHVNKIDQYDKEKRD